MKTFMKNKKIDQDVLEKGKAVWKGRKKPRMTGSDALYSFFDGLIDAMGTFIDHKPYRISKEAYFRMKNCRGSDIRQKLYDLKKRNLIKSVIENNEHYFELTPEGAEVLKWSMIGKSKRQGKWDKLFRLVVFDIPEEKKATRNVIRDKLNEIGFVQMQKSVFVYPFDCKRDIETLCYYTNSGKYLRYLVVKITEGEEELISDFLSKKTLTIEDLK